MKKISDRAVEIMIERHASEFYSDGVSWFDFNGQHMSDYPGPKWVGSCDILQALDEYQAEQEKQNRQIFRVGE